MGVRNVSEDAGFRLDSFHHDRELKKGQAKGLVNLYPGITCQPAEAIVEMNARRGIGIVAVNRGELINTPNTPNVIYYKDNVVRSSIYNSGKQGRYIVELEGLSLGLTCKNQIVFTNIDDGVEDFSLDLYNKDSVFKFLRMFSVHNNLYVIGDDEYYTDITLNNSTKKKVPFCISDKYAWRSAPAVFMRDMYPLSIDAFVYVYSVDNGTYRDALISDDPNFSTRFARKYRFQYVQLGKEDKGNTEDTVTADKDKDYLFDSLGNPQPNFSYITPVTQAFPEYKEFGYGGQVLDSREITLGNVLYLSLKIPVTTDTDNNKAVFVRKGTPGVLSKINGPWNYYLPDFASNTEQQVFLSDPYNNGSGNLAFDTEINLTPRQTLTNQIKITAGIISGGIRRIERRGMQSVNDILPNVFFSFQLEVYVIDSNGNYIEPATDNAPVGIMNKKMYAQLNTETFNLTPTNPNLGRAQSYLYNDTATGAWFEDVIIKDGLQLRVVPTLIYRKNETPVTSDNINYFYWIGLQITTTSMNFIELNVEELYDTVFRIGAYGGTTGAQMQKARDDGATHIRVWRTDAVDKKTVQDWQTVLDGRDYEYLCDIPIDGYYWYNAWRDFIPYNNTYARYFGYWVDRTPSERTLLGQLNTLNTFYQPFPKNVKNAVFAMGRLWVNSGTDGAWYYSEINGGDGNNSSTAHPEYYMTLFNLLGYYLQIPNNQKYGDDIGAVEFNGDLIFFKEYGTFICRDGNPENSIQPISLQIGCIYPNTIKAIDVVGKGKLLVFMSATGLMFMDTSYSASAFEAFSIKEVSHNGYLAQAYPAIKGFSQLTEQVYATFANNILAISFTDFSNFFKKHEQGRSFDRAIIACFRFRDDDHTGAFSYVRLDDETLEAYLRGEWNIELDFDRQGGGHGLPLFDIENNLFVSYYATTESGERRIIIAQIFVDKIYDDKILTDEELLDV